MELDEIRQLMELIKNSDITEILIERDNSKLRIKREKFMSPFETPPAVKQPASPSESLEVAEETQKYTTISSPIVGIFHRSPSPEGSPFVEVGDTVKKGQVLCIVEAMKLMNEIESDIDGTVSRILVENGHAVEYGEPLFLIEPAS